MIREFNRRQRFKFVGHLFLCLIASAAAYGFFFVAWFHIGSSLDLELSRNFNFILPGVLVGVVYLLGGIDLIRHGGLRSYWESSLFLDFDINSASSTVSDYYVSQATTSAFMISQILLCAPIQLMKAIGCIKSMVRDTPRNEEVLTSLLNRIQANGKWHDVSTYSGEFEFLGQLINMEKVEFSARKGVVKAA